MKIHHRTIQRDVEGPGPIETSPNPDSTGSALSELHGVRGFLTPGDTTFLFGRAASALVVTNGLLANLNLRARVYCVDTWLGSPEHRHRRSVHPVSRSLQPGAIQNYGTPLKKSAFRFCTPVQ